MRNYIAADQGSYVIQRFQGGWYVAYWTPIAGDEGYAESPWFPTEQRARNWAAKNLAGYADTTDEAS